MDPTQPANQLSAMDGMDEVIKEFLVECNEGLDRFDRDLVALEKDRTSRELLDSIFRAIHTIKGTGGVLGYEKLVSISHIGESVLSRMRDGAAAAFSRDHNRAAGHGRRSARTSWRRLRSERDARARAITRAVAAAVIAGAQSRQQPLAPSRRRRRPTSGRSRTESRPATAGRDSGGARKPASRRTLRLRSDCSRRAIRAAWARS